MGPLGRCLRVFNDDRGEAALRKLRNGNTEHEAFRGYGEPHCHRHLDAGPSGKQQERAHEVAAHDSGPRQWTPYNVQADAFTLVDDVIDGSARLDRKRRGTGFRGGSQRGPGCVRLAGSDLLK